MVKEMTAEQIRHHGLEALRRELGVVGMVRFMQQFTNGQGDYTLDRQEWQDQMSGEDVMAHIYALQRRKTE